MGESHDGPSPAARRAQFETEPESPARGNFLSRLFGWDSQTETGEPAMRGTVMNTGNGARNPADAGDVAVSVHKLASLRVEDVAVPRADIVAVPADAGVEEVFRVFRDSENTRLPVYDETLDSPIGLVHLKDFSLRYGFGAPTEGFDLRAIVRPLLYVPHSMPITVLLGKMQATRSHMALVIDEYGGVDGLVTIEDILEEIVGDIDDEHDREEGRLWVREAPGVYLLNARLQLEEFEEETGLQLAVPGIDEVDTFGGLVTHIAGRLPARGEVVLHPEGHELEVVEADARRIKRLRLRLADAASASDRAAE